MKSIKHFITIIYLLTSVFSQAQDVNTIVDNYKTAIASIESVHCKVEQLDTFVSGTVWHYNGELTQLRKEGDELFGFQFKASKEVGDVALYDGISEFQINHKKKTYELNSNPQTYITGSPGGQLVIPELMNYQDPEVTPELIEDDQYFVLRYPYPDLDEYDVREREKKIFLDKTTFLPVKVIKRQVSLGKKQVVTRIISETQINQDQDKERFQKDFLSSYKMIVEEEDEDMHLELLNTEVKDFQLETFNGKYISTKPKDGKLLLDRKSVV